MKACLDTDYRDTRAQCACGLFGEWDDPAPARLFSVVLDHAAPYEPGSFYKRELPALLRALRQVEEPLEVILVDGYVWLGPERGGLGWHLYEALDRSVPVIGVAKTAFRGAEQVARPLLRGGSHRPLWISAVGLEATVAAASIAKMWGEFRIPALLKMVDRASRIWFDGVV